MQRKKAEKEAWLKDHGWMFGEVELLSAGVKDLWRKKNVWFQVNDFGGLRWVSYIDGFDYVFCQIVKRDSERMLWAASYGNGSSKKRTLDGKLPGFDDYKNYLESVHAQWAWKRENGDKYVRFCESLDSLDLPEIDSIPEDDL